VRASSLAAAVVLSSVLGAGGAHGAVDVTVEPPTVARIEFDPREPPDDLPAGGADGSGSCRSVFEIESGIVSPIEMLTPTTVRAYPADFDIIVRLKTTIYTPKHAPDELRAHEEGHRAIAEHYYGNAELAAREAAAAVQSRSFDADGVDRAAAEQAVAELVRGALRHAFMQRTHARSAAANARYDAITRHGLEVIAATDAVVAAIAQDP
jgi:hypothetical protein